MDIFAGKESASVKSVERQGNEQSFKGDFDPLETFYYFLELYTSLAVWLQTWLLSNVFPLAYMHEVLCTDCYSWEDIKMFPLDCLNWYLCGDELYVIHSSWYCFLMSCYWDSPRNAYSAVLDKADLIWLKWILRCKRIHTVQNSWQGIHMIWTRRENQEAV